MKRTNKILTQSNYSLVYLCGRASPSALETLPCDEPPGCSPVATWCTWRSRVAFQSSGSFSGFNSVAYLAFKHNFACFISGFVAAQYSEEWWSLLSVYSVESYKCLLVAVRRAQKGENPCPSCWWLPILMRRAHSYSKFLVNLRRQKKRIKTSPT